MIRLGRGSREIWEKTADTSNHWGWYKKIVRYLLPPNPAFVKRMQAVNRQYNYKLSLLTIIAFCWYIKILRLYGMIKST